MNKKIILIISLVFLSYGCTLYHISSEDTTSNYYPSKSPNDVVHMESIDQPHEVIGTVTVNTERRQTVSDVIGKMKREAAILGGDAITNIKTDATGQWKRLPAQDIIGNGYVRANFTAAVVVFK